MCCVSDEDRILFYWQYFPIRKTEVGKLKFLRFIDCAGWIQDAVMADVDSIVRHDISKTFSVLCLNSFPSLFLPGYNFFIRKRRWLRFGRFVDALSRSIRGLSWRNTRSRSQCGYYTCKQSFHNL